MVATPHCNQLEDKPPSWIALLVRSVSGCLFASSYDIFREVTGFLGPGWCDMVLFLRSDSSYNTWRDKVPQGPGWCDKVLFLRRDSSCNTWRDKVPQRQGWCDKILFVRSDSSFNTWRDVTWRDKVPQRPGWYDKVLFLRSDSSYNTWRDVTRFHKEQGDVTRSCLDKWFQLRYVTWRDKVYLTGPFYVSCLSPWRHWRF